LENHLCMMDEGTKSALDILKVSLQSFIERLKARETTKTDTTDYNGAEFISQLGALSDTLSHECTKFSLVFTDESRPSAKACESLCNRLIGLSAALCKTSNDLPSVGPGVHFRRAVIDAVVDVFQSFCNLVEAAKKGSANVKAQLKDTGTVWEACERLKTMPKDSRALLLRNLTATSNLVNDAFSEIQEVTADINSPTALSTINEDDDNGRTLTEKEKVQLVACTQLIKAAKATLSKLHSPIEQSDADPKSTVDDDDQLTSLVVLISPSVDNVVSSFYDLPLDSDTLNGEVVKLHDAVQEILSTFRITPYYQEETHHKWIDILCTAAKHNLTKYNANDSESK